jgi:hypothetical protein
VETIEAGPLDPRLEVFEEGLFRGCHSVGIITGQSRYNALIRVSRSFADLLASLGVGSTMYSLLEPSDVEAMFEALQARRHAFYVSMQAWGYHFQHQGTSVFALARAPLISALGDPPGYHRDRLREVPKGMAIGVQKSDDIEPARQFLTNPTPVISWSLSSAPGPAAVRPWSERPYPFAFLGSAPDVGGVTAKRMELSATHGSIFDEALEIVESSPSRDTREVVREAFERRSMGGTEVGLAVTTLTSLVEVWMRNAKRARIVRRIRRRPLWLFGDGWGKEFGNQSNLRIIEANYPTGFEGMEQVQVALNIFPTNHDLGHDRLELAFMAGATLVSDRAPGLAGFEQARMAFGFDARDEKLDDVLDAIFADPAELEATALRGSRWNTGPSLYTYECLLPIFDAALLILARTDLGAL